MKTERKQSINREKLDAAFTKEEMRKSNLILQANLLKAQGQYQDATDRFAEAAQIEEQLSQVLLQKELMTKYFVHRFSALSCWAQAGNVYQAIVMSKELLARPDLPDHLRQRIQEHVQLFQARRVLWFAEFAPPAIVVPASSDFALATT